MSLYLYLYILILNVYNNAKLEQDVKLVIKDSKMLGNRCTSGRRKFAEEKRKDRFAWEANYDDFWRGVAFKEREPGGR